MEPDSPTLEAAVCYLEREGYIVAAGPGAGGDSYKITEAGWENLGYQPTAGGWRRRPWWKRMLGV